MPIHFAIAINQALLIPLEQLCLEVDSTYIETHYRTTSRQWENFGKFSPKWNVFIKPLPSGLRKTVRKRWEDCKILKNREFAARLCPLQMSEAATTNSHQHDSLNINCTRTFAFFVFVFVVFLFVCLFVFSIFLAVAKVTISFKSCLGSHPNHCEYITLWVLGCVLMSNQRPIFHWQTGETYGSHFVIILVLFSVDGWMQFLILLWINRTMFPQRGKASTQGFSPEIGPDDSNLWSEDMPLIQVLIITLAIELEIVRKENH